MIAYNGLINTGDASGTLSDTGRVKLGLRSYRDLQWPLGYILIPLFFLFGTGGCVVPAVTQQVDSTIDLKKFKSVSYSIEDQVKSPYSAETVNLFDGLLRAKLRTFGYNIVDKGGDFPIEVFVEEAQEANKAAMILLGFGAGRSLLTFAALFRDSGGNTIGRFTGGKSFHGHEFGGRSALWKSQDEMQLEMVAESVRQIARFIETNGSVD